MEFFNKVVLGKGHFHCDHPHDHTDWKVGKQHGDFAPFQYQYRYSILICCGCGRQKTKFGEYGIESRTLKPEDEGYVT